MIMDTSFHAAADTTSLPMTDVNDLLTITTDTLILSTINLVNKYD